MYEEHHQPPHYTGLGGFIMRGNVVTASGPCISFLVIVLLLCSLFPFSSSSLHSAEASAPIVTTAISPTDGTGTSASLGTIITSGTSTIPTNLCAANCV